MATPEAQQLLDAGQLDQKLREMSHALVGLLGEAPESGVLLGIRTRGVVMARRLKRMIAEERGIDLPLGILDITLYRDDLSTREIQPIVQRTLLEFNVTDKQVLLIDDVLHTGRTVRSAIDEIIDFGRPRAIRLAVMVEREGREYPIQPDYAALRVASDDREVSVRLNEIDGDDQVILAPPGQPAGD